MQFDKFIFWFSLSQAALKCDSDLLVNLFGDQVQNIIQR